MIRHIVLINFKPDTDEAVVDAIFTALAALTEDLPEAQDFVGGRSDSPEQLERGYQHGFVIDFASWAALSEYAEHPRHKALGAEIVKHAVGGIDGIVVLDLAVGPD